MGVNVLRAISNIVANPIIELREFYVSSNRANNMGESLEAYVKDLFAGTINENSNQVRMNRYSNVFSYQGNQNNPPDIIIRDGDAIEVKKIINANASLALNSSYPKAKLFSNSNMITRACRLCEDWQEKDILYAVGVVSETSLSRLFFVYGIDYAASSEIYERIRAVIETGIQSIPDVEFAETNEIGRVNRVDPLGITYLRVRGMWGIENPAKVFSYIYTPMNSEFEFIAIINTDKYNSFPENDIMQIESLVSENFRIQDVQIKTPDNPSILKNAKLITLCM